METIFALATVKGRSGVAVVRVSGPDAVQAISDIVSDVPKTRGVRQIYDHACEVIDEALILSFPAGRSFTGDEVIELHLHGSPAIISAILNLLGSDSRLRPAEAGEFTRRAMENGRLDLAQIEGLADLIDAETEQQRKQAMKVFSGAVSEMVARWRADLMRAVALLEATIDFVDEDVPVNVNPEVLSLLSTVMNEMSVEARGVRAAERVREGFEVAIIGPPNAGKSTLLNRLAGRDAAITSDVAGTTRDVIEVRMDIDGIPVTLLDTAGLREAEDTVEEIGVKRAKERAATADIRVHLIPENENSPLEVSEVDLVVTAKADVAQASNFAVSGQTGEGVDRLIAEISKRLQKEVASIGITVRERHRRAMQKAIVDLEASYQLVNENTDLVEVAAEHLWSAIRAVDSLVGRVDVEDILGEIFSSFCIGK